MNSGEPLAGSCSDLIEAYCDGVIGEEDVRRLEAYLLPNADSRREFVAAFHLHTELQFVMRARRAADGALQRVRASAPAEQEKMASSSIGGRVWQLRPRLMKGALACLVFAAVLGALLIVLLRFPVASSALSRSSSDRGDENVAWLVNAQDCQWAQAESEMPGRDMRAGKRLLLKAGLAQIEFDRGARVILQGPAELVLVSGSEARLVHGTLTARVPEPARGFTIISPRGKVVDLGTEFGLAVDDAGETTVQVFDGVVAAFPITSGPDSKAAVTIGQNQTGRIDGRVVELGTAHADSGSPRFIRSIEPSRVVTPHTLQLDFQREVPGSLLDTRGRGTGLTHRLPGTGSALSLRDPNLRVEPSQRVLLLTTTRSDLNTQDGMPTGEYLGFRLSDLGFTGQEDFEISTTIPEIPHLEVVGQFGLYVGSDCTSSIRGGMISLDQPDRYHEFLVNNHHGIDSDPNQIGLMTTGDDLRLTLRRAGGLYSLTVENETRGSSNTLTITHPAFLDQRRDLYAGIFGANTQSNAPKTLSIKELKVTVWAAKPGR